jgi:hypothetical protein
VGDGWRGQNNRFARLIKAIEGVGFVTVPYTFRQDEEQTGCQFHLFSDEPFQTLVNGPLEAATILPFLSGPSGLLPRG